MWKVVIIFGLLSSRDDDKFSGRLRVLFLFCFIIGKVCSDLNSGLIFFNWIDFFEKIGF